jgi:peptide/nickel transport system substrate-binding protein
VHVRRAISYAFDYDALIKVMSGFATKLSGPLPSSLPGADASITGYTHDIDKAKAELAQSAQYGKGGFELDFVYVTGLEEERQTGLIMLDALKQLNIDVKVTAVEWTNAVASFAKKETSPAMFPIYSGTDFPDPDSYLFQSYHSSMNGTWQGADQFNNPDVDKLLVQARSVVDEAQRTTLYNQIQQTIVDQAVEVFGFVPLSGDPHRKELQGYVYCPVMGSAPWWYEMSLGS